MVPTDFHPMEPPFMLTNSALQAASSLEIVNIGALFALSTRLDPACHFDRK
jgi:hypothetical protein